MVRPEKLATPATAACVGDPDSVPPPAVLPMASVTVAANPVAGLPKLSRAGTCMAGVAAPAGVWRAPAPAGGGGRVRGGCGAAPATGKSGADSTLSPSGTRARARGVGPPARDRQWYAVLSLNPATAAVATVPFATVGPVPVTTPLKAVPTGLTSTSSRSWSPGVGSVTVALKITDPPRAGPPTRVAGTPALSDRAL